MSKSKKEKKKSKLRPGEYPKWVQDRFGNNKPDWAEKLRGK